jgi:hypothetical protein
MTSKWTRIAAALVVWAVAGVAAAEDVYYKVEIQDLKFADGTRAPAWPETNWRLREQAWTRFPYIVLDGPGEAYVDMGGPYGNWSVPDPENRHPTVHVRSEQKGDIAGRLFSPNADWTGMTIFRFTLPASKASPPGRLPTDTRDAFLRTKVDHYHRLLARNLPGAAWFRHEIRQAEAALGNKNDTSAIGVGPSIPSASGL